MRPIHRNTLDEPDSILADTSLNAFGLILIVLMTYLLQALPLPDSARDKVQTSTRLSTPNRPPHPGTLTKLDQEIEEIRRWLAEQDKINESTGLWKFRVHVKKCVSLSGTVRTDFVVDYYVWFTVEDHRVQGRMFGAKDHSRGANSQVATQAQITGTLVDDALNLEFNYKFEDFMGKEILSARLKDGQFVGQLHSGRLTQSQSFEGPVVGSQLDDSDFDIEVFR